MSYSKDYRLFLEFETEVDTKTYTELVHSYPAAFKALEKWLWLNRCNNYKLISVNIKEI